MRLREGTLSQFSPEHILHVAGQEMERPEKLAQDIRTLLTDGGALLYIMNQILGLYDERKEFFALKPLFSEDDIRRAIGNQGELRGLNMVIQLILKLAEEPEPKDPQT